MLSQPWHYSRALILSILLHVVLLAVIFVQAGLDHSQFDDAGKSLKLVSPVKTVQAEVIDQQQLDALQAKKQAEKERKIKAAQAEEQRRQAAIEKKRREEESRRKLNAEKKRLAAEKRKQDEAKRKAEEQKKAEALKQNQLAEQKRQAAEQAAEEKRLAEERIAAEQRRIEAEVQQKRQQAELKAKLEAEEMQRQLDALRDAYRLAIKQKIQRNWRRPLESEKMFDCRVRVWQKPDRTILKVTFVACEGATETYRTSIERAVYRAEPLPEPGDPTLFESELIVLISPR